METVFSDLPLTLELLLQFYSLQLLCLKKGFHPHKKIRNFNLTGHISSKRFQLLVGRKCIVNSKAVSCLFIKAFKNRQAT